MDRSWMAKRRKKLGLTQKEVADAAGIAPNYLSQIEHGIREGKGETLLKLAQTLGVPLEWFYRSSSKEADR